MHKNLFNSIRVEVGVENGIAAEHKAVKAESIDGKVLDLALR